jgi:hypothetical protein
MKLDFSSELKSFIEDGSKFGVVSVTTKHCSTSLVKYYQSQFFWFPWQTILFLIPLANFFY